MRLGILRFIASPTSVVLRPVCRRAVWVHGRITWLRSARWACGHIPREPIQRWLRAAHVGFGQPGLLALAGVSRMGKQSLRPGSVPGGSRSREWAWAASAASRTAELRAGQSRRMLRPNNSFKPTPLRYGKSMAGKACHAFASTTRRGLTQALGRAERSSVIEQARSHYVGQLSSTLSSLSSQGRSVYAEICLELERPEVRNQLYRLYVVDILERLPEGETKVIEINVDPSPVQIIGLPVDAPIAWNGIEFRCVPEHFPEEALVLWGSRWIADESPPLGPQDNLTGIIHSVTEPSLCHSQLEFSVDFGSAPVAAFDELVALLGGNLSSLGSYSLAGAA